MVEVSGCGYYTGEASFWMEEEDPKARGFLIHLHTDGLCTRTLHISYISVPYTARPILLVQYIYSPEEIVRMMLNTTPPLAFFVVICHCCNQGNLVLGLRRVIFPPLYRRLQIVCNSEVDPVV